MNKVLMALMAFLTGGLSMDDYPITAYEQTGIRRLAYLEMVHKGEMKGKTLPEGAYRPYSSIDLTLADRVLDFAGLPEEDAELQARVQGLFKGLDKNYSLTVMDISPGKAIRYGSHRASVGYQPGSVGKLVVLMAFFTELAKIYPDNFSQRTDLLKAKMIRAGSWALHDHHTVPVFDMDSQKLTNRTVKADDVFNLYEWLDHMLSASNNGAASVVWREAVLMKVFGEKYADLTFEEAEEYFKSQSKNDLSEMAINMVNQPLRDIGIGHEEWRLGKFFTSGAGRYIPGRGGSIGTPLGLMKFMLALEKGEIVDRESSLEMKRLMYMTWRRIRYAASPDLAKAAVYFKSGSLYKCVEEEGFKCGKYMGNAFNYMNSVAIVEHVDGTRYLVCLMTNVLRKNSAWDHLNLASKVDKLMH